MSSALDTLLEAARFIELQELHQQRISSATFITSLSSTIIGNNNNNSSINNNINNNSLTQISASLPGGTASSLATAVSQSSNGNSVRYHHQTINNQQASSGAINSQLNSPVLINNSSAATSAVAAATVPATHAGNNLLLQHSQFSTLVRIDGGSNSEQPLVNGHTIAPPLVVISPQQQQQHLHHNNNNLHYHHNSSQHPQQNVNNTHSPSPQSYEISRSRSSSVSSNHQPSSSSSSSSSGVGTITTNGIHHVLATGEDSSQSSLNLSNASSGYLSGSSGNSSVGGISSSVTATLNLNNNSSVGNIGGAVVGVGGGLSGVMNGTIGMNGNVTTVEQQLQLQAQQANGRRRTTSTNSNGGTQRSPCILRAGTREVHNKLEKNRRAHLKECFEQLKKQLPQMPEEKKTSNLSILGAANRHIQTLKRKERELEHEMERLAKEKIAAQQRIIVLKRELSSQYDQIDFATLLPDPEQSSIVREREPSLSEPSMPLGGRSSIRYSSSSSLSSIATVASPSTNGVIAQGIPTIGSPVPNSPRPKSSSPLSGLISAMPLSLTTKNLSTSPHDSASTGLPSLKITVPSGLNLTTTTSGVGTTSIATGLITNSGGHPVAINLTTSDGISPALLTATSAAMPLNLNSTGVHQSSQGLHIISTTTSTGKEFTGGKNGLRSQHDILRDNAPPGLIINGKEQSKLEVLTTATKLDTEPPTKVIKLINGSIALASVDKENKIIPSGQLTLSQVVGGGGLVVSPIPLLTSSQGLRVISQAPNNLATIELSTSSVAQQSARTQNSQASIVPSNGPQLHKLLVSGSTLSSTANGGSNIINTTAVPSSELARLPGGAELNILPAGANGTTLYRGHGGKLAIVNNGITLKGGAESNNSTNRAVHVVTPLQPNTTPLSGLTPIVVSQGQGGANLAHLIATSPQLAGKMVTAPLSVSGQGLPLVTGTQYLSTAVVKPMVVAVASSNNNNGTTSASNSVPPSLSSSITTNGNVI